MFSFFKKNKSVAKSTNSLKKSLSKPRQKFSNKLSSLLFGKKSIDDKLLEELETLLISADVGIKTTDKVLKNVCKNASHQALKNENSLYELLKNELAKLLIESTQLNINTDNTFVILMVGVNGVGKTTTIGKLAKKFQAQGKSIMLAAGDTFRAAAIEQLTIWGERNNIPVVSQNTGADAASVIFDAYKSATVKNIDILIADTAGRLHTQSNLMQELSKIKRVLKKHNTNAPHETMLIIDGSSGQNAINQANEFNKIIKLNSIVITKLDGTAKGGVVFAIANELKLPIRYIGVGENIDDLKPFDSKEFINALLN